MQRSYRLVARLVRIFVDLKAGVRTGVRSAAAQTSSAASGGAATVGRGLKGATLQGGLKDVANGGRTWWSQMPKNAQLPGALADAANHHVDVDMDAEEGGWDGPSALTAVRTSPSSGPGLTAIRTETPAELLLSILADMADGREPNLRDVALARTVLIKHLDLYEPLNSGGGIRMAKGLDADVVHALMHQLGEGGGAAEQQDDASGRSRGVEPSGGMGRSSSHAGASSASSASEATAGAEELEAAVDSLRDALAMLLSLQRSAAAALDDESGLSDSGSDSDSSRRLSGVYASVPAPMLDEVERALARVDAWQYDTWHLAEVTQGHALSCLAFHLLHREGLIAQFRIQPTKLARLLRTLESGYAPNPYHNSTHAADVLQTLHVLLHGSGLTAHYLDRLGLMAAYFAAAVHDHGHPGLTADFLIATSDPLAVTYNDRAPLENHHGASFFGLLRQPDMDALAGLSGQERGAFRKQVLDLVMATDMKQHFSLLAHFNTAHQLAPYAKEAAGQQGAGAEAAQGRRPRASRSGAGRMSVDGEARSSEGTMSGAGPAAAPVHEPRPVDETERTLSLQIALKAADLGHLGEELEAHKRWVRSLEEEFFAQGDRERAAGLPISPLFDRTKQGVSKSQVGFYDFIALPLMHALAAAFPGAQPLAECCAANYNHWRDAERAAAAVQAPALYPEPA